MILRTKITIAVVSALMIIAAFAIYVMVIESDVPVIGNHPPRAVIDAPSEVILSQPAVFSGEGSYDDDGDKLTYFWEFDDGSNTTGPVVEHTFTVYFGNVDDDTHMVNLTVSDGEYEDSTQVAVTVIIPKEAKPPEVLLSSSVYSGLDGITYLLKVDYISEGDANIKNISYSLVSTETGEELANGTVSKINQPLPASDPVSYKNNYDDYMETLEWFTIDSEALNATEGDMFYLYHVPTGIKMSQCQLSG